MSIIQIRHFCLDDIDFILENWSGTERMKGHNFPDSRAELSEFINELNSGACQVRYFKEFAVLNGSVLAGIVSLYEKDDNSVSLGVFIDERYRSKGFGAQAVELVKDEA